MLSMRLLVIIFLCGLFAACSSGGGLNVVHAIPDNATGSGSVTLAFDIPQKKVSSGSRSAEYISFATQSFVILTDGAAPQILNVGQSSAQCMETQPLTYHFTLSCAIVIHAPLGNHTFTLTAYSQANGQGEVLSSNTSGNIMVTSQNLRVPISLKGVIASIRMNLSFPSGTLRGIIGVPEDFDLEIQARDQANVIVTGQSLFMNPITVISSDPVNGVLSKTIVRSPADLNGLHLHYTGGNTQEITLTASADGIAPSADTTTSLYPSTLRISTGDPGWTVIPPGSTKEQVAPIITESPLWPFQTLQYIWISDASNGGQVAQPQGIYKYFKHFTMPAAELTPDSFHWLGMWAQACVTGIAINGGLVQRLFTADDCDSSWYFGEGMPAIEMSVAGKDLAPNNLLEVDVQNDGTASSTTGLAVEGI